MKKQQQFAQHYYCGRDSPNISETHTDSDSDGLHKQAVAHLFAMPKLFVQTFNELCFCCYRTSTNILEARVIEFFKGQV